MSNSFKPFNGFNRLQAEQKLASIATNLAPALDDLLAIQEPKRYGFAVFLVDRRTGAIQYISSIERDKMTRAIREWVIKESTIESQNVTAPENETQITNNEPNNNKEEEEKQ